jgi:lipoyl(octanoyl) transferase
MSKTIVVNDLGRMAYRPAWEVQQQVHESVVAGGAETILVVEHTPVITLGRRGQVVGTLLTPIEELASRGVELVHSDRGGDITYHGPGQIVAYPIIRLIDHGLTVGGYVHKLEAIVIGALAEMGIHGETDPEAVGVWVAARESREWTAESREEERGELAKICAIGVRIRRGVTMHGLALNAATDLTGFSDIVPCGLAERKVTSVAEALGGSAPQMARVKEILVRHLAEAFSDES